MSATLQAFSTPRGPLTIDTVQDAVEDLGRRVTIFDQLDIQDLVLDTFGDGLDTQEDGLTVSHGPLRTTTQAITVEGEGFLRITRICPGWEGGGVADKGKNGFMEVIIPFSEGGLDPVAWASFRDCLYTAGGQELRVTAGSRRQPGDVRILLGDNAPFGEFGKHPLLFEIDLGFNTGQSGLLETATLEFQLDLQSGQVEMLLNTDEGNLVATVGQDRLGVRASNGDWSCNLEEARCTSDDGQEFGF